MKKQSISEPSCEGIVVCLPSPAGGFYSGRRSSEKSKERKCRNHSNNSRVQEGVGASPAAI